MFFDLIVLIEAKKAQAAGSLKKLMHAPQIYSYNGILTNLQGI
jgi:hypothetical protein